MYFNLAYDEEMLKRKCLLLTNQCMQYIKSLDYTVKRGHAPNKILK